MIVVKHVDSIFGSLLPIRLSTFKLVFEVIIVGFSLAGVDSGGWDGGVRPNTQWSLFGPTFNFFDVKPEPKSVILKM